jgi:hypothetical protein
MINRLVSKDIATLRMAAPQTRLVRARTGSTENLAVLKRLAQLSSNKTLVNTTTIILILTTARLWLKSLPSIRSAHDQFWINSTKQILVLTINTTATIITQTQIIITWAQIRTLIKVAALLVTIMKEDMVKIPIREVQDLVDYGE